MEDEKDYSSSLFLQNVHPIVSDHVRSIESLLDNQIVPGQRGREYVLRRLLRQLLSKVDNFTPFSFSEILQIEKEKRDRLLSVGRKMIRRHGEKSDDFWWETFGILPEERSMLR